MYDPASNGHSADIFLSLLGLMCLAISWICNYIIGVKDVASLFFAFSLSAFFIPVTMFFAKWCRGYRIEDDGVYFKYRFLNNKILFNDIQCIIISNTELYRASTKDPYVTLIRENGDDVIQWCINQEGNRVLTGEQIRFFLSKINRSYNPVKFNKVLKDSSCISYYGFRWNKKDIGLILKNYKGPYFIARSIVERYKEEVNSIMHQYNIGDGRVNIIEDFNNKKK